MGSKKRKSTATKPRRWAKILENAKRKFEKHLVTHPNDKQSAKKKITSI